MAEQILRRLTDLVTMAIDYLDAVGGQPLVVAALLFYVFLLGFAAIFAVDLGHLYLRTKRPRAIRTRRSVVEQAAHHAGVKL